MRSYGPGYPLGTLIVNIIGSFLMGVLVVGLAHFGGTRFAPFLAIGVLGGFTTFSSFSLDAVTLIERGAVGQAALYVAASVVLSLAGLFAGLLLARAVTA
jgi:CrcB protein